MFAYANTKATGIIDDGTKITVNNLNILYIYTSLSKNYVRGYPFLFRVLSLPRACYKKTADFLCGGKPIGEL